jgi:hypothetical protein
MGLLGKVMAVLNVVAAIIFVCLAILDYGIRQGWMVRVRQQDFIINGLPIDESDRDVEGLPVVTNVTEGMQKRLFEGAGQPVRTQLEEVQKQERAQRQAIEQNAGNLGQVQKDLEALLVPMARTWGERQDLRERIRKATKTEDLMGPDGPFAAAFRPALQGQTAGGSALSPDQRRQAIALLLFGLAREPADRQHVVVVVGLDAYARAVTSQAAALEAMIPALQSEMVADRAGFVAEYTTIMEQIRELNGHLLALDETLVKQSELQKQQNALVLSRKKNIEDIRADIAAARKVAAEETAEQSRLETELFKAQGAVDRANRDNQKLENQIRERELGQKGGR